MCLLGGGELRAIVSSSTLSLTASTATIYRGQLSFLHSWPVAAIPSLIWPAASGLVSGQIRRAFATYNTTAQSSTPPSATRCPRRSFYPPQPRTSFPYVRMTSTLTLPKFPIFEAIARHNPQSIAITHCLSGRAFKYGELLPDVCRVRDQIHETAGKTDLRGERIAFLVENSYDYVGTETPHTRT
jgi:hypothetical protein